MPSNQEKHPDSVEVPNVFGEDGKPITIQKSTKDEPPTETLKKLEKKRGVPLSKRRRRPADVHK